MDMKERTVIGKEALFKEFEMAHYYDVSNYWKIVQNVFRHCDELVIKEGGQVVRLIGINTDDDDHYYLYEDMQGKRMYDSCVGGYIILKNRIDDEDYNRMEYTWALNDGKMERYNDDDKKEFKEFFKLHE